MGAETLHQLIDTCLKRPNVTHIFGRVSSPNLCIPHQLLPYALRSGSPFAYVPRGLRKCSDTVGALSSRSSRVFLCAIPRTSPATNTRCTTSLAVLPERHPPPCATPDGQQQSQRGHCVDIDCIRLTFTRSIPSKNLWQYYKQFFCASIRQYPHFITRFIAAS